MALPLSKSQAQIASQWLRKNFEGQIKEVIAGTPWNIEIVCAIACQETALRWILWIDKYDPQTILSRCVFDASGEPELPGNTRSAFPKNRDAFKAKYGETFLQLLVNEGNKMRSMPQWDASGGYKPMPLLYKGWGIFQYDLQHITQDEPFFSGKLWYSMSECLVRLVKELNTKAQIQSTLFSIVKSYNGSGTRAEEYAKNVLQFANWV